MVISYNYLITMCYKLGKAVFIVVRKAIQYKSLSSVLSRVSFFRDGMIGSVFCMRSSTLVRKLTVRIVRERSLESFFQLILVKGLINRSFYLMISYYKLGKSSP